MRNKDINIVNPYVLSWAKSAIKTGNDCREIGIEFLKFLDEKNLLEEYICAFEHFNQTHQTFNRVEDVLRPVMTVKEFLNGNVCSTDFILKAFLWGDFSKSEGNMWAKTHKMWCVYNDM